MSSLARPEHSITPAHTIDTVTERELRWVKLIDSLNNKYLLENDRKEDNITLVIAEKVLQAYQATTMEH
jgi:hypothetical protein